jgi:hypothetical protein
VTHHLGGKTRIVLSLHGGEEANLEPADAHEASLIVGLLGSLHPVEYDPLAHELTFSERKGERDKAREYCKRFVQYWGEGEMDRDKVAEAKRKAN